MLVTCQRSWWTGDLGEGPHPCHHDRCVQGPWTSPWGLGEAVPLCYGDSSQVWRQTPSSVRHSGRHSSGQPWHVSSGHPNQPCVSMCTCA